MPMMCLLLDLALAMSVSEYYFHDILNTSFLLFTVALSFECIPFVTFNNH